jgi:metal-sulfur cluster biosynthetic enzyme
MVSRGKVYELLQQVIDPELGINIVDLGLVYDVEVDESIIRVDFTLTYPGCPLGPLIQKDIVTTLQANTGIKTIETNLVWQPLWQPELMSEEARVSLGYPI